jgi:Fic/DOC family
MSQQKDLAKALELAKAITKTHHANVIHLREIDTDTRKILTKTGWLQEIIRGWYILVRPDTALGDSAAWYANMWDFVLRYMQMHYGDDYCLSAESSLSIHAQTPLTPRKIIVITSSGGHKVLKLPYDTSLVIYADEKNLPALKSKKSGLNIMPISYAICKASPTYFKNSSQEAEIILKIIPSAVEISETILAHNFKRAAARILGAYKHLNMQEMFDGIQATLSAAQIHISPSNPFKNNTPALQDKIIRSPYAARIKAMWKTYQNVVLDTCFKPPGLPKNPTTYLAQIKDIYKIDAYHSLSIEGYQVSEDLIEKVKTQQWNPDQGLLDNQAKNALAAKGYYDAFLDVTKSIESILAGNEATEVIASTYQNWYRKLFGPSVTAEIIPPSALAGFRNSSVYIRNSMHSPPPKEALIDSMDTLFDCLANEKSPAVQAILGNYFFVYIHPYMDGNGRLARFLMNALFASGGYPWAIIRETNRRTYIDALEHAHTKQDIEPFARFIMSELKESSRYF